MPDRLKAGLEQLSGLDLSDVRVRYGSSAPVRLGTNAFAAGRDIEVAPGREADVAHEGWHVVQQLQGRVRPTKVVDGQPINADPSLEREADDMGSQAMRVQRSDAVVDGRSTDSNDWSPLLQSVSAPGAAVGRVVQRNGVVIVFDKRKYDITIKEQCDALLADLEDPFDPIHGFFACAEFLDSVERNEDEAKTTPEVVLVRLLQLGTFALSQCIELQMRDPIDRILKIVKPHKSTWFPSPILHGIDELRIEFLAEAQKIARLVEDKKLPPNAEYLEAMDACCFALTHFTLEPFEQPVVLAMYKMWPVARQLLKGTPIKESGEVPPMIVEMTEELDFPQVVGSKHEKELSTALTMGIPLGFESREKFVWFVHQLMPTLQDIHGDRDLTGVVLIFQGSAVNGQSYWAKESDEDPNKLVKKFDEGRISDFDIGLVCPALWQLVYESGITTTSAVEADKPKKSGSSQSTSSSSSVISLGSGERTASIGLKNRTTAKLLKILDLLKAAEKAAKICSTAPREVNFMIYSTLEGARHHQGPSLTVALAKRSIQYIQLTGQFEEGKQGTKQATVGGGKTTGKGAKDKK